MATIRSLNAHDRYFDRVVVSEQQLEERRRAREAVPTLTALICGDPPPGRSALDKMNGD